MIVTISEFQKNFAEYINMLDSENFLITKDEKIIAKVTNPNISAVDSLRGILKGVHDIDLKAEKEKRFAEYENND